MLGWRRHEAPADWGEKARQAGPPTNGHCPPLTGYSPHLSSTSNPLPPHHHFPRLPDLSTTRPGPTMRPNMATTSARSAPAAAGEPSGSLAEAPGGMPGPRVGPGRPAAGFCARQRASAPAWPSNAPRVARLIVNCSSSGLPAACGVPEGPQHRHLAPPFAPPRCPFRLRRPQHAIYRLQAAGGQCSVLGGGPRVGGGSGLGPPPRPSATCPPLPLLSPGALPLCLPPSLTPCLPPYPTTVQQRAGPSCLLPDFYKFERATAQDKQQLRQMGFLGPFGVPTTSPSLPFEQVQQIVGWCQQLTAVGHREALLSTAAAGLQIVGQHGFDESAAGDGEAEAFGALACTLCGYIATAADNGATLTQEVSSCCLFEASFLAHHLPTAFITKQ